MIKLFGVDIAKTVNAAVKQAGGVLSGTLTRVTPGSRALGSLTSGTNPTTTSHAFEGFAETRETRRADQVGASSYAVVTILGASVSPETVPRVNDSVSLGGATYTLLELVACDPASAVYEFRAQEN